MGSHSKAQHARKSKTSERSCSSKLILPVNRIHERLRDGKHAEHVAKGAAVYLAAVMEYLAREFLCLATATPSNGRPRRRILSRHLQMAVMQDVELKRLLEGVTFAQGYD